MSVSLNTPQIDSSTNNSSIADYQLQVKDIDNNFVNMQDYKGKVIFLNFWATWCMPCVAELPSINKLYLQLQNENIAFLLISSEDLEKVKRYHDKKKYEVPFHVIDKDGFIPAMYHSNSIPTTFIIDKEGQIVKAGMGAEDWDNPEFISMIKKIL